MTAPAYFGAAVRKLQHNYLKVPVAQIVASTLNLQVVPAFGSQYAIVPTRFRVRYTPAGAALGGVGANDNLVLRYTDASGVVQTKPITGVGFLDASPGTIRQMSANVADLCTMLQNASLQLAYAASADGVTLGSATGFLDVFVEYDVIFVG